MLSPEWCWNHVKVYVKMHTWRMGQERIKVVLPSVFSSWLDWWVIRFWWKEASLPLMTNMATGSLYSQWEAIPVITHLPWASDNVGASVCGWATCRHCSFMQQKDLLWKCQVIAGARLHWPRWETGGARRPSHEFLMGLCSPFWMGEMPVKLCEWRSLWIFETVRTGLLDPPFHPQWVA